MTNRLHALSIALIFILVSLSGCIFANDSSVDKITEETIYPSIYDRHTLEWKDNHTFSYTLEQGPYFALDVQEAFIEVDTSEVWETGPDTSTVHLSYWLPSNTLDGEQVPVIAVISPYFSYGSANQRPLTILKSSVHPWPSFVTTLLIHREHTSTVKT